MFLFWGPDLLCFYNDAYRVSLGDNGKHPAVGKPGADVWPEIWNFIGPLIDRVMNTGKAVWFEDQLVPIYRNGQLEDVYWTFSYSPTYGDDSRIAGVFVTCTETTSTVLNRQRLEAGQEQLRRLIEEAPVAMALFRGTDFVITLANERVLEFWGRNREQVMNVPLFAALPEASGQGFEELLMKVYTTGERFIARELPVTLERNGQLELTYIDFVYEPFHETDGTISGITVVCVEITEQVLARQKIEESEARFRSLIEESPVATCLFTGQDLVIDVANEEMIRFFGHGSSIVGKSVREVLTNADGDEAAVALLTRVFTTGEPFTATAAPAQLTIDGVPDTYYFDLNLKPLRNAAGAVYAVLETATDVTEQVQSRRKVEASEARFRSLIEEAPVATCLFVGREFIIEIANEAMVNVWGKGSSVMGQPLAQALPELNGQSFLSILDEVFTSGQAYSARDARKELEIDGVLHTYYFDFTYKPLRNAAGEVYAIMDMAVDVTETALARQKLEEAESGLRVAVEMAQLGTWSIDVATNGLSYSERLIEWFGYDPKEQDYSLVIPILDPNDQDRVARAVAWALNPESNGVYNEVYTVIHPKTGAKRILHAQGKTVFDAAGKAVRLNGTAQDITMQRELQLALEQQVQERTEELAVANKQLEVVNEELAAINEELVTSNEETMLVNNELAESNNSLSRSNENLEKFAYIASHDLQEPLRKIQAFGDLLIDQYGNELGGGIDYLQRMQSAANRMSTLIRDLLTYSRIATQQETVNDVPLTDVLTSVLMDLDLRIQETGATVTVVPLPVIHGDRSQLEQLFQNLISNALKFRRAEVSPAIDIRSRMLTNSQLPASVKPARSAACYYCIDVTDNGIGFDEKYVDRIFQVFQRLHGRGEFAGTGIGLAICEKVATNHGGAITAHSQPGQGATFSIYLPQ